MANPVNPNQNPLMFSQFPAAAIWGPGAKIVGLSSNYPGVNFSWTYEQIAADGPAVSAQLAALITSSGQTLNLADATQASKAVANYHGVTLADSSIVANHYTPIPLAGQNFALPTGLFAGLALTFGPTVTNTGDCVIEFPAGIVKSLLMPITGAQIPVGLIKGNNTYFAASYTIVYNGTSWFLTRIPQVQANWNENNTDSPAFIQNKPNVLGFLTYMGTWNATTNTPTLANPPDALTKGFYYVVSAAGTQFGITFAIGDWIVSNGSVWEKIDNSTAVSSVFGRVGAVVAMTGDYTVGQVTGAAPLASPALSGAPTAPTQSANDNSTKLATTAYADAAAATVSGTALLKANNLSDLANATTARTNIGLGNVDNTSDANKPVSTAQQTALNLKANLASPALTGVPTMPTAAPGTNTTQGATTAFVTAAVAAAGGGTPATNAQTGTTYTLQASDNGALITLNNASAVTLTVPQQSTLTTATNFYCAVQNIGAGTVTIVKQGAETLIGNFTLLPGVQCIVRRPTTTSWSVLGGTAIVNMMGLQNIIASVINSTITLTAFAGCAGTILGVGEDAGSLTTAGTFAIKINGTTVTGLSAVTPTTAGSYTTASALNTFSRGDVITITYAGTLAIVNHSVTIDYTQGF